jgi:uncharacterized protein (TIGR02001 family)
MKLKHPLLLGSLLSAGLFVAATGAQAGFSANIGVTTDYVWRGVSQTDSDPAIQGGLDWEHDSGFYLGLWGSNVDFGSGTDADVETDIYGGFKLETADGLGFDFGVVRYLYPGSGEYNMTEIYVGGSFNIAGAKISYDPDNDNVYYEGDLTFELPEEFGLVLHAGYYDFDKGDGVFDWKVGLTKSWYGLDFELAYTDTDLSGDEAGDIADGRVYFSVGKAFDF